MHSTHGDLRRSCSSWLGPCLLALAVALVTTLAPDPAPRATAHPAVQPAPAASSLTLVGQLGGTSYAVATQGALVFVGVGPRLVVLDATDPAALRVVGRSAVLDGVPLAIVVRGNVAYVGAGDFLYIVDVSDARRPRLLGSHHVGRHTALALHGDHVFVTSTVHLLIVDVAEPGAPREIDAVLFGAQVQLYDIAIDGDLAFVAVGKLGLMILDLANPTAPRPVASIDTPADAQAVAAGGGFAYVGDRYVVSGERTSLGVVDVRDPAEPVEVARLGHLGITYDVHLAGDRLYVAAESAGVLEIDVATPSLPRELSRSRLPGQARGVAATHDHVFVADELDGLHALSLASAPPTLLPARPMLRWVNDVAVADGRAFVAEGGRFGGGVRMLDISDPARLLEIAYVDTTRDPLSVPGQIKSIEARGDWVYATGFVQDGFHVLRGQGDTLEEVAFLALEPPRDLAVWGDHAYVTHHEGVAVIDVSRPESPRQVTTIAGGGPYTVEVVDDVAYVAAYRNVVQLFDVSEPASPRRLGTMDVSAEAYAVEGDVAVVLDGFSLRTFDVSDPNDPRPRGLLPLAGSSPGIDLRDGIAYVVHADRGVAVVDVSVPTRPTLQESLDRVCCGDVVVDGDHLYLAGWNHGLVVVSLREPATTTPSPTPTRPPARATPTPRAGRPFTAHLPWAVVDRR